MQSNITKFFKTTSGRPIPPTHVLISRPDQGPVEDVADPFEGLEKFKRIVSVDIDGTIANISARMALAGSTHKEGSTKYWDMALCGSLYHLDEPLLAARDALLDYVSSADVGIAYLSGRRSGTEHQTRAWLLEHGFPSGNVVHRRKGVRSKLFKCESLRAMRKKVWVECHVGDRLEDDGGAAAQAGVKFFHIKENDQSSWHAFPSFISKKH